MTSPWASFLKNLNRHWRVSPGPFTFSQTVLRLVNLNIVLHVALCSMHKTISTKTSEVLQIHSFVQIWSDDLLWTKKLSDQKQLELEKQNQNSMDNTAEYSYSEEEGLVYRDSSLKWDEQAEATVTENCYHQHKSSSEPKHGESCHPCGHISIVLKTALPWVRTQRYSSPLFRSEFISREHVDEIKLNMKPLDIPRW